MVSLSPFKKIVWQLFHNWSHDSNINNLFNFFSTCLQMAKTRQHSIILCRPLNLDWTGKFDGINFLVCTEEMYGSVITEQESLVQWYIYIYRYTTKTILHCNISINLTVTPWGFTKSSRRFMEKCQQWHIFCVCSLIKW